MACLMSRGLMSGWAGTHNPTYKADQLDAATAPSASWSAVSFSGPCNGYLLGFGQLYMNYKADESGGRIDYSSSTATDNPLLSFMRNMLTLATDFNKGFKFLVLADTNVWAKSNDNPAGLSYYSMFANLTKSGYTFVHASMSDLESGGMHYVDDSAFYNQFRGVIVTAQRTSESYSPSDAFLSTLNNAFVRGLPFIVLQKDGYSGQDTIDRLFPGILKQESPTFVQLHSSAISQYTTNLGEDAALAGVEYLDNARLYFAGSAAYSMANGAVGVVLDELPGTWYLIDCAQEYELDAPDVTLPVVERAQCCVESEVQFRQSFDVSMNIVKPTDWRSGVLNNALAFKWWGDWEELVWKADWLYLRSAGLSSANAAYYGANLITYRKKTYSGSRSYNVMVLDRSTGDVISFETFDVHNNGEGNTTEALRLSAFLDSLDKSVIVVIVTWDEPKFNMAATPLIDSLVRCGATRYTLLHKVYYRSAYILVGVPGDDTVWGIEYVAGTRDSDPASELAINVALRTDDSARLVPIMSSTADEVFVGEYQQGSTHFVVDTQFVKYLPQIVNDAATKAFLARVLSTVSRSSTNKKILIASDSWLDRAFSFSEFDPQRTFARLIDVVESLGYNVSYHDIKSLPPAEPKWFTDYSAIICVFADVDGSTDKVREYCYAMAVALRLGVGGLFIGDSLHLSSNMNYLLSFFGSELYTVGASGDTSCYDLAAMSIKHQKSTLIHGLSGVMQNDNNNGGALRQETRLLPYVVNRETFKLKELKNSGRTAAFEYTKVLDYWDSMRQFAVHGFGSLTDTRFKKIDMSDGDDFYLHMGLPCVLAPDYPSATITDASLIETDGPLAFNSRWTDLVTRAYMIDHTGVQHTGVVVANNVNYSIYELAHCGVRIMPKGGDIGNAYRDWWGCAVYSVYLREGNYAWRLAADNTGQFYLDGVLVGSMFDAKFGLTSGRVSISEGWHTVELRNNNNAGDDTDFAHNPCAISLLLHPNFLPSVEDLIAASRQVLASLTVSLSEPVRSTPLVIDYATVDGSAKAVKDYVAKSGTLVFNKGEQIKNISIEIIGETKIESDEHFYVDILQSRGDPVKSRGTVTIVTDDPPTPGGAAMASGGDGVMYYPVDFGSDAKVLVATIVPYTQPDRLDLFDDYGNFLVSSNAENDLVVGNVHPRFDFNEWSAAGSVATMALSQNLPKHSGFSTVFAPHYFDEDKGSSYYVRIEGATSTGWAARTYIDRMPIAAHASGGAPVTFNSDIFNCHGILTMFDLSLNTSGPTTFRFTLTRLADGTYGVSGIRTATGVNVETSYQMRVDAGAKLVAKRKGVLVGQSAYAAIGETVTLDVAYDPAQHDKYLELYVDADPAPSAARRGAFFTSGSQVGDQTRLDWECVVTTI